jgi:hypothetical protein
MPMTEQEFQGWMIIAAITLPVLLLAWLLRQWEDARDRKNFDRLNRPAVIDRAYSEKITREQAADDLDADDAEFYAQIERLRASTRQ